MRGFECTVGSVGSPAGRWFSEGELQASSRGTAPPSPAPPHTYRPRTPAAGPQQSGSTAPTGEAHAPRAGAGAGPALRDRDRRACCARATPQSPAGPAGAVGAAAPGVTAAAASSLMSCPRVPSSLHLQKQRCGKPAEACFGGTPPPLTLRMTFPLLKGYKRRNGRGGRRKK